MSSDLYCPRSPGPSHTEVIELLGEDELGGVHLHQQWTANQAAAEKRDPQAHRPGGRTEGLDVLDIGCGPGECIAGEIEDFGAIASLRSTSIRRWSSEPVVDLPNMEIE